MLSWLQHFVFKCEWKPTELFFPFLSLTKHFLFVAVVNLDCTVRYQVMMNSVHKYLIYSNLTMQEVYKSTRTVCRQSYENLIY